ncbi:MAG: hypothetical protein PUC58_02775 [Oscillospiraceae bacterium]|nr:hypothetical protein [Oscillospiraceae bacterium]
MFPTLGLVQTQAPNFHDIDWLLNVKDKIIPINKVYHVFRGSRRAWHALLNSMFTMFYIEASGFGRGLGVLDVNKDSIANCYMLNPKPVSKDDRAKIIAAFEKLKSRQIMRVSEELSDDIRLEFELTVLRSFGIDDYFEKIKSSLLSMQETRATVRE